MENESDIVSLNTKNYDVLIYSKSIKNTLNLFIHNYLSIPALELEIHPGRFYYGTHHTMGAFIKRSVIIKKLQFCEDCINKLLKQSYDLFKVWYYPIVNCETLTRGLTQNIPISIQTILITGAFTSLVIGISYPSVFLLTFLFIILLLLYNNFRFQLFRSTCIHNPQV
ncbi:ac81-like protein [Penaeus vannamei nudivirus]|nr:ac81-like protein [Penaeus vannamei nucleopolyhedrovirus]